ncbi:TonB-dependent receptor [Providencia vermicola]|uniref:TonB-dependent receptor domain-containing protein n=1 Tax=Providencia vermicola TaxID=333965 RepID=UPI001CECA1EF|nr:TonB-dependent receptor [Providencia vermicola]
MNKKNIIALNISAGLTMTLLPTLATAENKEHLGTIIVNDKSESIKERDQKGADDQYDRNESNVYLGKETVERYKGANPADVLNSAIGVYSGDARNSGALDPNIRGIQGQGRVPVTVDGTEQALTVWRGYNGANNRNYVDPNMISSITIDKSPSLNPEVKTSVGGGIAIRTLNIDDVVAPDDEFGFDLKLETSSNSTKPREPHLRLGSDYRDDPDIINNLRGGVQSTSLFNDPAVLLNAKSRGNANFFNFKDNAVRIAVGTRQERFDVMAAYSYRNQGNYFAGTRGANRYKDKVVTHDPKNPSTPVDPYLPFAANVFAPGKEVTNTSSEMETYLFKTNLFLSDSQKLSLGYTHTTNHYGEIMPSRISFMDLGGKVPQWPLAKFNIQAFNADYFLNPEDNPYVNMKLGYWMTKTTSDTNTSGGFPREPKERDHMFESGWGPRNPNIDGTLIAGAALNSINKREGVNLSNKLELHNRLDLTLMGSFTKETIDTDDDIFSYSSKATSSMFRAVPREGEREETTLAFNFEWRPTDWLNLTAGAQRTSYWSQDHLLNKRREAKDPNYAKQNELLAKNYNISRTVTEDEYNKLNSYVDAKGRSFSDVRNSPYRLKAFTEEVLGYQKGSLESVKFERNNETREFRIEERSAAKWTPNGKNKFTRETNPFYNGTYDTNEQVVDPFTGELVNRYVPTLSGSANNQSDIRYLTDEERFQKQKKKKAHAWAPAFSASAYITDDDRVFASYTETVRMPSVFEDTVGFSGSRGYAALTEDFVPERGKTIEIGYVRNMQSLLGAQRFADVRINYYHTVIENAFERDNSLRFTQVDEHNTAGIEVQARYDNGNVFGDIGVDYRLKNEVCDSASVALLDPTNKYNISRCIDAGFPGGFLRTQLQPKYSINSNIGMRFLDEQLEVGSRMRYHSKAENNDEKEMMGKYPANFAPLNNSPMRWNPVFVADAYVSYDINKDMGVELLVTNLLDEYYVDPLTRTMMPAPGRTFRLSFSSHF